MSEQLTLFDVVDPIVVDRIDWCDVPFPPRPITLTAVDVGDPITRYGKPARDEPYRRKLMVKEMLRKYGYRLTSCGPATDAEWLYAAEWW